MPETGTFLDDLPAASQPQAPPAWDDVADKFTAAFPGIDPEYIRKNYEQSRGLAVTRQKASLVPETSAEWFQRRSLPVLSAALNASGAYRYGEAKQRLEAGRPGEHDYDIVAGHELQQQRDQEMGRTNTGYAAQFAAHLPAIAGEFAYGGAAAKALTKAVGLAPTAAEAAAQGGLSYGGRLAAGLAPKALARTALSTAVLPAGVPSMWAEQGVNNNREAGRAPGDLRGFGAAYGLASLKLGVMQGVSSLVPNVLAEPGAASFIARAATKGAVGIPAAMAANVAGYVLQQETGYGSLQALLERRPGDAAREMAGDFVTFALFHALHEAREGTPAQQKAAAESARQQVAALVKPMEAMAKRGASIEDVSAFYQNAAGRLRQAMDAEPNQTQDSVAKLADEFGGRPEADYLRRLSTFFPKEAPKAPESPVSPSTPAQPSTPPETAPEASQGTPEAPTTLSGGTPAATEGGVTFTAEELARRQAAAGEEKSSPEWPPERVETMRQALLKLGFDAGKWKPERVIKEATRLGIDPMVEKPAAGRKPQKAATYAPTEPDLEAQKQALMTSKKWGTGNTFALDEADAKDPKPFRAVTDVDDLNKLNESQGKPAGDALIRAKIEALKAAGLEPFHAGQDEFVVRGDSQEDLAQKLEQARTLLQQQGGDFSYGIGATKGEADDAMREAKGAKKAPPDTGVSPAPEEAPETPEQRRDRIRENMRRKQQGLAPVEAPRQNLPPAPEKPSPGKAPAKGLLRRAGEQKAALRGQAARSAPETAEDAAKNRAMVEAGEKGKGYPKGEPGMKGLSEQDKKNIAYYADAPIEELIGNMVAGRLDPALLDRVTSDPELLTHYGEDIRAAIASDARRLGLKPETLRRALASQLQQDAPQVRAAHAAEEGGQTAPGAGEAPGDVVRPGDRRGGWTVTHVLDPVASHTEVDVAGGKSRQVEGRGALILAEHPTEGGAEFEPGDWAKIPPGAGEAPGDVVGDSSAVDESLEAYAKQVRDEHAAKIEPGNEIRKEAYRILKGHGVKPMDVGRAEDPDQVKGFDEAVDQLQPLLGGLAKRGELTPEETLFRLLKDGMERPMTLREAREQARAEMDAQREYDDVQRQVQRAGFPAPAAAEAVRGGEEAAQAEVDQGQGAEAGATDVGDFPFGAPLTESERRSARFGGGQPDAGQRTRPLRVTALANAQVDQERQARGQTPLMKEARQSDPVLWDRAMARLEADSKAEVRLVDELAKKRRPTTDVETMLLLHRRVALFNEEERAQLQYVEAMKPANKAGLDARTLDEMEKRVDDLGREVETLDRVLRETGTEAGRAFRIRQLLMAEDFSLAGILRRATAAKKAPLTDAERQQFGGQARQIAELQKQLAEAQRVAAGQKPGSEPQQNYRKILIDSEDAKNQIKRQLTAYQKASRTTDERLSDLFIKLRINEVISSPTVLEKITNASALRLLTTPLEEAAGSFWSRVPGLAKIAAMAPRQGRGLNLVAEKQAIIQGLSQGIKDAWRTMKTGQSELDVLHGEKSGVPRGWLDLQFSLHDALKAPAVRAEFTRSFLGRLDWNTAKGEDVTRPDVLLRISSEAYKDAQAAKFRQENWLVDAVNRALRPGKDAGFAERTAKTAGKILLPVVRIPTNLAFETGEYLFGTGTGSAMAVRAYVRGIDSLKPEEADLIMRHFKKGSLGLGLLLLGYFRPDLFGGYYSGKRDEKDVKPGAVRAGSVELPAWSQHNPLLQTAQFGATVRRAQDQIVKGKPQGLAPGVGAGMAGLAEELPMVRETGQVSGLTSPNASERGHFLGELLKSLAVPQVFQWLAGQMDVHEGENFLTGTPVKRKPQTVGEDIETGVPGLRQRVPAK